MSHRVMKVTIALVLCALAIPAAAQAAKPKVELRVVDAKGKQLANVEVKAASAEIPTSPDADCFGEGTGGSGIPLTLAGPTALGVVAQAAEQVRTLRPLELTDAFDFGLGVCGIGGAEPQGTSQFWTVRVDHEALQVGGDQFRVRRGDHVLWALVADTGSEPAAPALELQLPARAEPGDTIEAEVTEYADDGREAPAEGVKVSGAAELTDADGATELTLTRSRRLVAKRGDAIASAKLEVCVKAQLSKCPRKRELDLVR